jgi:ParB family transcriptional regulator, chromosome partitioning protein
MSKEPDRNQRKALGKGLSALLPSRSTSGPAATMQPPQVSQSELPENFEAFQSIPLDQISPGTEQPRLNFDEEKLTELAESIKANGVIQPITVRHDGPGKYRIIAGERRWRASQIAGLPAIPALIRTADEHQRLEMALIENLQREDLNPMEVCFAFKRLIDEHRLSHEQVAQRTGKDRSTVTNFLRLQKASGFVQSSLRDGKISMGHARALLNLPSDEAQDFLCSRIIEESVSVRATESAVQHLLDPDRQRQPQEKEQTKAAKPEVESQPEDPNVRAAIQEMEAALGTRVRLTRRSNGAGRLEVEFYSTDDLDRIYSVIVKS